MTVSEDAKLQALIEHYKETFLDHKGFRKLRDWLFLSVLLLTGFQFFQVTSSSEASQFLHSAFKKYLGLPISEGPLNTLLWFALLAVAIRYFQTNIHINKQYKYISELEKELAKFLGENIICREGAYYSKNYSWFSRWTEIIYTRAFPILLILTGLCKIIKDFPGIKSISFPYFLSVIFYISIFVSTVLYLWALKGNSE